MSEESTVIKHAEVANSQGSSSTEADAKELARLRRLLQSMLPAVAPQYQSKLDASDIIQQTMMEACDRFADFRGTSDAELIGWLRQSLSHNHLDAVRSLRSQKRDVAKERQVKSEYSASHSAVIPLVGDQTSPSRKAVRDEELERVETAIGQLPDLQGRAVRLHHLQGWTLAEIAAEMKTSRGAVAGLLHRGLRALHDELSGLE